MKRRVLIIVFLGLLGLHAVLMGSRRIYPFIDLPSHLNNATIIREYDEPANRFQDYFDYSLLSRPNVAYYFIVSLPIWPSAETGNRVFYVLYVLLFPLAALLVIRRLGGNPWFALLAFLLLYNFNVGWGFTGFTISLPMLMLLFAWLLDDSARFSFARQVLLSLFLLLLFFTHAIAFLFAAGMFGFLLLWRHPRQPLTWLKQLLLLLPTVAFMVPWWTVHPLDDGEMGLGRFFLFYYSGPYWHTIIKRLGFFVFDNYFLFPHYAGYLAAAVFASAILLPLGWAVRRRWGRPLDERGRIALALTVYAALCFFLLPDYLPGHWALFQRFSVCLLLALIFIGSVLYRDRLPRGMAAAFTVLALAHFGLWADYHHSFAVETKDFTPELFPEDEPEAELSAFITDNRFRGRQIFMHFQNYFLIWHQGIVPSQLYDYRFKIVWRKENGPLLPTYIDFEQWQEYPPGSYDNLDYLLVRGQPPASADSTMSIFEPVRDADKWMLYRRKPQ